MLKKLEMHDIQDKTRLCDEMNETRQGVNDNRDLSNTLARELGALTKKFNNYLNGSPTTSKPKGKPKSKSKTGSVKPGSLGPKPD